MRARFAIWILGILLVMQVFAVGTSAGAPKLKPKAVYGADGPLFTVATGSPGALGLLKAVAEPFCRANNCRISWVKKGSGASLRALKAGQVDMVMVHAPAAEKQAVQEGWAAMRTLLGSNEFYVVGPPDDPAGIRKARFATDAFSRIARAKARFFSRGDHSGTHKKEMGIWKTAGIEPKGDWYVITNDFMGPTLMRADKEKGYFMTDSSTFFVKKPKLQNVQVLFKGDPVLINVYHALVAAPGRSPKAKGALAVKFVDFLKSEQGQKIYRTYGISQYGSALYNDAEYARRWEH
jgi:tungstate transport system substrate-binding protein